MSVVGATVIHYVEDMDRAIRFYSEGLGFEVASRSTHWSTLSAAPGWRLALHAGSPAAGKREGAHPFDAMTTELSLDVDDLPAALDRVQALGGTVVRIIEPRPHVPVRMGLIRDSEGNGLQLNAPA